MGGERSTKEFADFNNITLRTIYNVNKFIDVNPNVITPAKKKYKVCNYRTTLYDIRDYDILGHIMLIMLLLDNLAISVSTS